jgi:hypothetical protein
MVMLIPANKYRPHDDKLEQNETSSSEYTDITNHL